MSKEENPIERLLDVEDNEPITLYDEKDHGVKFEQIALIPYEEKLYAMLKPIDKMDGVEEDEAVIFVFEEDKEGGEKYLKVVGDDKIIDAVFEIYLDLVKEEEKKDKKHSKKCECEECKAENEEEDKETAKTAEKEEKPKEKKQKQDKE